MPVRFAVEEVFHLRQRGVLLASGRMLEGSIAGRVTAYDEATGRPVQILGIELLPPSADHPERVTLIIDPSSPTHPVPGMVLVTRED